jgi:hypothetical protein
VREAREEVFDLGARAEADDPPPFGVGGEQS